MPEPSPAPAAESDLSVSIVVPVYNGAATIAACVTSLLALEYPSPDVEIIVVDNRSTDGTPDVLRSFDGRIRVLAEGTRGAGAARNCGIRTARGRAVAFTDADCVVEPGWLTPLVAPLANRAVGVVGGRILSLESANWIERFGERIHDHRQAIENENPPYAISMNWASRREVLREAGGFDETFLRSQDVDLAWRLHRRGYRLVYAPDAIVRHHNERTLRGLMHEGFVHGRHAARLRATHADLLPASPPPLTALSRRLVRDLRRLARLQDPAVALLALLFDLGKTAGELGAAATARRRPHVRDADADDTSREGERE